MCFNLGLEILLSDRPSHYPMPKSRPSFNLGLEILLFDRLRRGGLTLLGVPCFNLGLEILLFDRTSTLPGGNDEWMFQSRTRDSSL